MNLGWKINFRKIVTVSMAILLVFGSLGLQPSVVRADSQSWTVVNNPFNLSTADSLTEVTYGGGRFVAVGSSGLIMTSTDGLKWTTSPNTVTTNALSGVAYGNNVYVAVGANGTLIHSTDLTSWSAVSVSGITTSLQSVKFINGTFWAVGGGGTVLTSTNGQSWSKVTFKNTSTLMVIDYINGKYAIGDTSGNIYTSSTGASSSWSNGYQLGTGSIGFLGSMNGYLIALDASKLYYSTDGTTWSNTTLPFRVYEGAYANGQYVFRGEINQVLTSTNLINWTQGTTNCGNVMQGFAYGNGVWVMVGVSGYIIRSTDGVNWMTVNPSINHAIYVNGLYVAVGSNSGNAGLNGVILTSIDGRAWTSRIALPSNSFSSVAYGSGKYVAVGSAGIIYFSIDGVSWNSVNPGTSTDLQGVRYVNGMFMVSGASGTLLTSVDGTQWTSVNGLSSSLYAAAYGKGKYVVAGNTSKLWQSVDGTTWTSITVGSSIIFRDVIYAGEQFVAAGSGGNIYTSDDGGTWTKRSTGTTNVLLTLAYGNNRYIAAGVGGVILSSEDGATWSTDSSGVTSNLNGVTFNGSDFMAFGKYLTTVSLSVPLTAVTLESATVDGTTGTMTSTKIDLTFDKAIRGLTAEDITITDGTGSAVKGALTGSGTSWSIALDSVMTEGNVSVAVNAPSGYIISGSPKPVAVYKAASGSLEATPNAGIDYVAEQLTGFTVGATYTVNSTPVTVDSDGKLAIDSSWLGTTIQIVKKGDGASTTDSAAQPLAIPARPAAPIGVAATNETTLNGHNGTLTGVDATMQYKQGETGAWIPVAGIFVANLTPDMYFVRKQATETAFASSAVKVNVEAFSAPQEATPNAGIDYVAEQLTGFTVGATYTVNGTPVTVDSDGKLAINSSWLGTAIQIVKKGDGASTTDSAAQPLAIPARPAAPIGVAATDETTLNGHNGTLTGVDATMQYKQGETGTWIPVAGIFVANLAPDMYFVRKQATETAFASAAVKVNVEAFAAPQEATPNAGIDYMAEQLTGFTVGATYTVNGTPVTVDSDGKLAINSSWLGTAIQIVKKGDGASTTDSAAQSLPIPARPAAPIGVAATDETTLNGHNGTLTGVDATMQYKQGETGTWIPVAGIFVTNLAPDMYFVRKQATETAFASVAVKVNVEAFAGSQEATPNAGIDYVAEQLTGFTVGATYTVNGTPVTVDSDGKLAINSSWLGTAIQIVKKGDGASTTDSEAQSLPIPARPAAPIGVAATDVTYSGANNGTLADVNSFMEYKQSSEGSWMDITGTTVSGLAPDTYYVRIKATDMKFTSVPAQLTVHDSDAVIPSAPGVTADDENNLIVGLDTTMEFSVDGGDYVRYDGTNAPNLSGEHTVWVRVAASGSVPEGPETILTFTANPPVPASGLTVTSNDPRGSGNDGKTKVAIAENLPEGHSQVYFIFSSGDVTVPMVGDVLHGYTSLPSDGIITAANGDRIGIAEIDATGKVVRFGQTTAVVTAEPSTTPTSPGSTSPSPSAPSTPLPSNPAAADAVEILVNGKAENAGKATTTVTQGTVTTTIAVDPAKLQAKLDAEGNRAVVTIPVKSASDVIVGELNGQMVRNMEDKSATLVIKTDQASYTLPAEQINIDAISSQLGGQLKLEDIKVRISIAETSGTMAQVVKSAEDAGRFTIVAPALDFKVTGEYDGKTTEVTQFNEYIERRVALPDGIDPSKITTGVVVDPDGTVRHVPTKVEVVEGKYYAVINSLTNSTYSVVWHPVEFSDVANHWAKDVVNNMGSRMVINGVTDTTFKPNDDITRAEFAAIIVRGLGLKLGEGANPFSDVAADAWYAGAVQTASTYDLITGFEDGTFRPNDKITREQAMTIIAKAMKLTGLADKLDKVDSHSILAAFTDGSSAGNWAKESIAITIQASIVNGKDQGKLEPAAYVSRAEVAALIQRLLSKSDLI